MWLEGWVCRGWSFLGSLNRGIGDQIDCGANNEEEFGVNRGASGQNDCVANLWGYGNIYANWSWPYK